MAFTNEQMERYSRHIILQEVGVKGQKKLLNGKVLIIGAGGLGAPAAMYLAAAGVGTIGIVDADEVDLSNLQRQIIHGTGNVGMPKVESAAETVTSINPDVTVKPYHIRVSAGNIAELIAGYDVIVDAADNFSTKFLINDACVLAGKPYIYGGALRFEGQLMTYVPGRGPCYRCIFRDMPAAGEVPSCKEAGVLGAVVGVIGSMQAVEAVKLILGVGKPLRLAFEARKLHSLILWGPPGVGKTTLARLMADAFDAEFMALSAVFSGVKDIREAVACAEASRAQHGRPTILFVDEVHRFNKAVKFYINQQLRKAFVQFLVLPHCSIGVKHG